MFKPALHVMFGPSGAGWLRQALEKMGRADRVVSPHDDFSFGPIASGDAERVAWVEEELGVAEWDLVVSFSTSFLEASLSTDIVPVAWVSRLSVQSYAGFLWWLSHLGAASCKVIDVTDLTIRGGPARPDVRMRAVSPSLLSDEDFARLVDTGVDLDPASREASRSLWKKLAAENAPLRIIDKDGALVSAPINHFDPLLLSCVTTAWQKMARIVGDALERIRAEDDLQQVSDLVLAGRSRVLAETGALEWRGDLGDRRSYEARLPASTERDRGGQGPA